MTGTVAILVKTFPKLSETFVLGEILGLEKLGLPVTIFALQRGAETIRHDETGRVRATVHYLEGSLAGRMGSFGGHLAMLVRRPAGYLRALALAMLRDEPGALPDLTVACRLAAQLLRARISHVHAHFASRPAAVAELASAIIGGTFSISAHAKDIYLSSPEVLARKLARATFTVTCTAHNLAHLRAIAPRHARVELMYHGIDANAFAPPPPAAGEGPPLVLAVGRLREKKGFDVLVRACAELRDRGTPFRCEIVGYGEREPELAALIDRLALGPHVALVGRMNHAALRARYAAATVFAAPCRVTDDGDRDGIPNVLLEAMAMSVPVVTTPVSGIPEVVIDGETGLLAPPDDPLALARCLEQVITSPSLRGRLGPAGRHLVVERFDNDRNLQTVCGLLTGCSGGHLPATASEREDAYA